MLNPSEQKNNPTINLAGHKVLLVEDDERTLFAMHKLMEKRGIEVITAQNGEKALDALNKNHGIEIILMDIMMPVMDGYEAILKIRQQEKFKDLPIIVITANIMMGDKDRCFQKGATDYLTKPVHPKILFEKLLLYIKTDNCYQQDDKKAII